MQMVVIGRRVGWMMYLVLVMRGWVRGGGSEAWNDRKRVTFGHGVDWLVVLTLDFYAING